MTGSKGLPVFFLYFHKIPKNPKVILFKCLTNYGRLNFGMRIALHRISLQLCSILKKYHLSLILF